MEPASFRDSFEERQKEQAFEVELRKSRKQQVQDDQHELPSFLARMGKSPITLSPMEYRIIRFLADQPYRAFTRSQIVEAVSTPALMNDATLDQHIQSLRAKLGIFSDYIQSVPYIGYRFKP